VAELTAKDSAAMPQQLTKFELPLAKVEEVRNGTIDLSDAVSKHVRAKWSGTSLQNPRRISEALRLVTTEDLWAKGAEQINAWNGHRTSFTAQTLKQKYVTITDRRNKIAHEADLLDGDLKRRRPISEHDARTPSTG
jgi:restriction system protein